jgi:hypothetical protein
MSMIQAVSYNFSTVENPLSDGGVFTTIADVDFTGVLKVIAGNLCETVTAATIGGSFYSGTVAAPGGTWPNDQYSEMTVTTLSANSFLFLVVRQGSAASGTQYVVHVRGNSLDYTLFAIVAGVAHTLATTNQSISLGDVFRLQVVGNVLTLFRNSIQVQTFTDTNNFVTSGSPGFGLSAGAGITDAQTSLWAAGANQAATPTFSPNGGAFTSTQTVTITSASGGTIYYTTDGSTPTHASSSIASGATISVAASETVKAIASVANNLDSTVGSATFTITPAASYWSQPDCRNYGNFPNTAVNVEGTLTYTTPSVDSRKAGAPVDSRAAGVPIDSRTNKPTNSRTPGTFGPGE